MSDAEPLHRTALYDEHVALGARMVPFAGFEMPVQYAGIFKEHAAVRERAGMFDLSHMAQFELYGEAVPAFCDALTVNAVGSMKPFAARYNIFANERGGAHDDVLFYRLPDRWLLVANAANAQKISRLLHARNTEHEIRIENLHGRRALVAVQGPRALEILGPLCDVDLGAMKYYSCAEGRIGTTGGVAALIARTGYTGEDGFELFVDARDADHVWRQLLEAGAPLGLEPAGLGARDVLRLEAGMPLYGFELDEELGPLPAGQGWAVKFDKGDFVGKAALEAQRAGDDYARIAGLVLEGRVPARHGYPVFAGERRVGEIRSAATSPTLGKNIATALVEKAAAATGSELSVEIRGVKHPARVVELPFYTRAKV